MGRGIDYWLWAAIYNSVAFIAGTAEVSQAPSLAHSSGSKRTKVNLHEKSCVLWVHSRCICSCIGEKLIVTRWVPLILSVTGTRSNAVFAGTFDQRTVTGWLSRFGLTDDPDTYFNSFLGVNKWALNNNLWCEALRFVETRWQGCIQGSGSPSVPTPRHCHQSPLNPNSISLHRPHHRTTPDRPRWRLGRIPVRIRRHLQPVQFLLRTWTSPYLRARWT